MGRPTGDQRTKDIRERERVSVGQHSESGKERTKRDGRLITYPGETGRNGVDSRGNAARSKDTWICKMEVHVSIGLGQEG